MGRFDLFESLEGRQLFAGVPGHFGSLHGPGGNLPAISQPITKTTPLAVYKGTVTFAEDSSTRPFSLVILTEGTDGTITASIPGHRGPVQLTGTKSGSIYTLTGGTTGNTVSVTATVDASGNVTGSFSRTYTENGTTETDSGTLALTKADATTPPTDGGIGGGKGGHGLGHGPDDGTHVALLAVYDGTLTLSDSTTKHFDLAILTEATDGTITARLGHHDGIDLTGTKSGSTYTLTGTRDNIAVSITATVDASGNVTGNYSKVTTATDNTTTTETGTIALTKKTAPTKPADSSSTGSTAKTIKTTVATTLSKTLTTKTRSTGTRPTISNLLTYKGKMTIGDKTADVTIQTYTLSTGKTLVAIRSPRLLGKRTLVLEATINGNSVTASRTDGDRSVTINLTTAADGSITGSIVAKKGTVERTYSIDADKVATATT